MLKNYNKLAILSVILLAYTILVMVAGFPLFDKIFDKLFSGDNFIKNLKYMKYMDILSYFLLCSFLLALLASVITGITALFKIRKTKEKGEIVAVLTTAISALWLFASIYSGWGLWQY